METLPDIKNAPDPTELAWLEALSRGDESALRRIFDRHYPLLLGDVYRLIPDESTCQDLAQEVIVELWRKRAELDIRISLRAYLRRAAINRALNHIKTQRRFVLEGSDDLVRLNHASPDVVKLVGDVMTHWLARGIDGWRLDAAYAVDPQFWAQVLDRVRAEYPQALFVGEVIHTDLARVSAATVDSITAYELWKSTWSAINDRNFFELDWTMTRHDELLELVRPLTFVSNHDVTRIISKVGPQGALLALVVLATVGGMPSIYYGDEGGLPGIKYERPGGDDEVRPEMPAAPLDWQLPHPEIWQAHRALIALRRKHPWLVDARHEAVKVDSERYVYKMTAGDQWLQVELDMTKGYSAVVRDAAGEAYRH